MSKDSSVSTLEKKVPEKKEEPAQPKKTQVACSIDVARFNRTHKRNCSIGSASSSASTKDIIKANIFVLLMGLVFALVLIAIIFKMLKIF